MRSFPTLQIPNLKPSPVADQSDFIFQSDRPAKFFRQNKTSLPVRTGVLRPRMQVPQKNTAIPRGNTLVCFCRQTHSRKLLRRHDEQKLMSRFREQDKFLCLVPPPARGNRDSIFLVNGMPELASIETLGWRIVVHVSGGEFIHFAPLGTTFNHLPVARS